VLKVSILLLNFAKNRDFSPKICISATKISNKKKIFGQAKI